MITKSLLEIEGRNTMEKLLQASRFLNTTQNSTLIIPEGEYIIYTDFSRQLMYDVFDGKMTQNPQDVIFKPYYKYDSAIVLKNAKNVKIVADGAKFIINGFMQAVEISGCENVELIGLTTDFLVKPFSVGKTVKETQGYIDVEFEDGYCVTENTPSPRIIYFDRERKRFSANIMEPDDKRQIGERTIRYFSKASVLKNSLDKETIVIHTYHYRPNVYICDSKNVKIDDVTIHAHCGMGILVHRCEDVYIDKLKIVPAEGRPISTNTDATHFTSCKGKVEVTNSVFAGSEDDVINIHNYYYTIKNVQGNKCDLVVNAPDYTHAQVIDYPDIGDTLALIDKSTLKKLTTYNVTACAIDAHKLCACVELDKPLCKYKEKEYFLINETRRPELVFRNNTVEYNLSRGVLIKCKKAEIENCVFKNTTGTAVHIAPESWWHEGGSTEYVSVKNNRFVQTGFGSYAKFQNASAVCVEAQCDKPVELVHRDIYIENNIMNLEDAQLAVYVSNTANICIKNNEINSAQRPYRIKKIKSKK